METKKAPSSQEGRVDLQKLYALLCGLKASVDRLALQVKQLRNEQGGRANE